MARDNQRLVRRRTNFKLIKFLEQIETRWKRVAEDCKLDFLSEIRCSWQRSDKQYYHRWSASLRESEETASPLLAVLTRMDRHNFSANRNVPGRKRAWQNTEGGNTLSRVICTGLPVSMFRAPRFHDRPRWFVIVVPPTDQQTPPLRTIFERSLRKP